MDEMQQLHLPQFGCDQEGVLVDSTSSTESEEELRNVDAPIVDGRTIGEDLKPDELSCCSKRNEVESDVTIACVKKCQHDCLHTLKKDGYDVAGPMYNITAEPGVVSAVHLPHSLFLEGLKNGVAEIECGHFKDGKFNIIKPVAIEAAHIVLEKPSSGVFFALSKLSTQTTPLEGKVLVYCKVVCPEDMDYLEYTFHIYVVPIDQPKEELDKEKEDDGFKPMKKPQQIPKLLYTGTDYTFRVEPYGDIYPEHLQIKLNCKTENLPFVEVNVDKNVNSLSFSMLLKRSAKESAKGSTNVLWKVNVTKGELREMQLRAQASVSNVGPRSSTEHFVDKHRKELIEKVSNVKEVLDEIKNLTDEQYDTVILKETYQDQMRMLFTIIRSWGSSDKDKLLEALEKTNKPLINNLREQINS